MSLRERVQRWIGGDSETGPRVRVVVKGRIGEGWFDVDRWIALPEGATLGTLIAEADRQGLALTQAIADSPHLRHTLMWNGQRAPVDESLERAMGDGDEIYLLGPVAGG
ncbi:MAG: MoaD/ThiS family protein [Myxococcota bacterium]|nr:MoaD/ThiS family protein [Myxococcales bacterium]